MCQSSWLEGVCACVSVRSHPPHLISIPSLIHRSVKAFPATVLGTSKITAEHYQAMYMSLPSRKSLDFWTQARPVCALFQQANRGMETSGTAACILRRYQFGSQPCPSRAMRPCLKPFFDTAVSKSNKGISQKAFEEFDAWRAGAEKLAHGIKFGTSPLGWAPRLNTDVGSVENASVPLDS